MLRYPELRCIFYSADALRSCSVFVLKCNWWSCLRCIRLCILFSHVTCTVSGTAKRQLKHIITGNSTCWDLWKNSKFGDFQYTAPTTEFYLLKTPKFPPELYAFLAVLNRLSEWFTTAWIDLIKKKPSMQQKKASLPSLVKCSYNGKSVCTNSLYTKHQELVFNYLGLLLLILTLGVLIMSTIAPKRR